MKDRIETIIKDYLVKEYGNENALPKPVLNGLVDTIYDHSSEIHSMVQEEYDLEDIDMMAESHEVELTDEERSLILHRYKNLEDGNLDTLSYIIDEVVEDREEKNDENK